MAWLAGCFHVLPYVPRAAATGRSDVNLQQGVEPERWRPHELEGAGHQVLCLADLALCGGLSRLLHFGIADCFPPQNLPGKTRFSVSMVSFLRIR